MSNAVIDTNILVSGLWNPSGAPGNVLSMILAGRITPWYSGDILCEYADVLYRKEFPFAKADVDTLLGFIQKKGIAATFTVSRVPFADESDRIFYDVAVSNNVPLITGNLRHYPAHPLVLCVSAFLADIP
ncbi:MAG: putative toxin-antitoxin system toxin component, PIN family [Kiritimatiellae bacterium]|nr:putative toxin-antitoxin system toxin component, PIN family [Kiritimatiellia bacterium]